MIGCVEKCEATDCVNNMDGRCGADGLWLDSEGHCSNYDTEGITDEELMELLARGKEQPND